MVCFDDYMFKPKDPNLWKGQYLVYAKVPKPPGPGVYGLQDIMDGPGTYEEISELADALAKKYTGSEIFIFKAHTKVVMDPNPYPRRECAEEPDPRFPWTLP